MVHELKDGRAPFLSSHPFPLSIHSHYLFLSFIAGGPEKVVVVLRLPSLPPEDDTCSKAKILGGCEQPSQGPGRGVRIPLFHPCSWI